MSAPQTPAEQRRLVPEGYRVLVVGGSSGIGRTLVAALARDGARVVSGDLPGAPDPAPDLSDLVRHTDLDIGDEDGVGTAVGSAVDWLGGLDAVVNCAGILGRVLPAAEEPLDQFHRLIRVNLVGAFLLSRAVLPIMADAGYGRLLHLASIAGKEGNPQMTGYSASKAGVIGMVKALAKEYAGTGVTINAIAPASIETPMIAEMTPERRDVQRSLVPMGRFGTATEAATLIRFLISPEASFSTGFVHDLSGGRASY